MKFLMLVKWSCGPPLMLTIHLEQFLYFKHIVGSLLNTNIVDILFLQATPNRTPLKYKCPNKKNN